MTAIESRRTPFRISFEGIPAGASCEAFIRKAANVKMTELAAAVSQPNSAAGQALREYGAVILLHSGLRIECPILEGEMDGYNAAIDWMDYIIQFGIILRQHHGIDRLPEGPARTSMLNNLKTLPMDRKVRMRRLFGNDVFERQTRLQTESRNHNQLALETGKRDRLNAALDLHLQTLQDISSELVTLVNLNVEPDNSTVERLLAIMSVSRSFNDVIDNLQKKAIDSQMAEELETDSRVLPTVHSESLDLVPTA